MSLRQVFRSKLKSLERSSDKGEDSKGSDGPTSKSPTIEDIKESEMEPSTSTASDYPILSNDSDSLRELDEKGVYELQLTQLQEQLVAAMIENQNLSIELKSFKEENQIEKILKELEYERQRNQQLAEEIESVSKAKAKKPSKSSVSSMKDDDGDWVDVAQEAIDELDHRLDPEEKAAPVSLRGWFVTLFCDLMADFTEDAEPEDQEDADGEQLAVKKLKDNMKRFKHGTSPIYNTIKGMYATVTWKNPSVTLIVFAIYMYSVWHGWLLPVTLFLMIFRLFVNYLRYRGWNINIRYFTEDDSHEKESDASKESSVSEKFNLVLLVARQVQNKLGKIADSLEKIKNLLTWKQPEATLQLFLFLSIMFVFSCVLKGTTFFLLFGLYMGFKMFILEFIYNRFPRFKQHRDSVHQIWKNLPTDWDLVKRYQKAAISRQVMSSEVASMASASSTESIKDHDKHFCEIFELPHSEKPRPGWEAGRRCTLIDKDKSWTSSFKSGKLYLTMSFLCFERYKSTSPKNILIALADITRVLKAKPYTWMPGAGMSIEVTVTGYEKPYIFGAMLSRDECFDNLIAHGLKRNLAWAKQYVESKEASASSGSSSVRRESLIKDKAEVKGDKTSETSEKSAPAKETTFRMSELADDMNNYFVE